MKTMSRAAIAAFLFVAAWGAGCASAPPSGRQATAAGPGRPPYSEADVEFMSGMIPHHAQAVVMAGWAPTPARARTSRFSASASSSASATRSA